MLYLHIRFKHYNPVLHAVSDYGTGASRRYFTLSGYCSLISTFALFGTLLVWNHPFASQQLVISWLAVKIVSLIGLMIFPTDLPEQRKTLIGLLHYLFAILNFTATLKLAIHLTPVFTALTLTPSFKTALTVLQQLFQYSLTGVVLAMLIPPLKRLFGLIERVFLYSSSLYFLVINLILLTENI